MTDAALSTRVLVVTHGPSGGALLDATRALVGAIDDFEALEVGANDTRDVTRERIRRAVERLGGRGVVVAVDLHGSTPFNVAVELSHAALGVAVVSGVNLPMLMKLASVDRARDPADLARLGVETALKSIRAVP